MHEISRLGPLREQLRQWRSAGVRLAFVPTMGNLHDGHLQLVEQAQAIADRVVVSIFVNPLQFGAGEDFASYPRTLQRDRDRLQGVNTDLLFIPEETDLYPNGREQCTRVSVPELNAILCGKSRPGHFDGVATVVAKLLNLVQPDVALFGKKDYQQLLVIRRLVDDLNLPVEIVGIDTVREADGLAMSSRNGYLSPVQRQQAPALYRALSALAAAVGQGQVDYLQLQRQAADQLNANGFVTEYVEVRRRSDLALPGPQDRQLVVLAAARLGHARLIDNLEIDV